MGRGSCNYSQYINNEKQTKYTLKIDKVKFNATDVIISAKVD